ncbi:MAG: hypothetical protein ACE5FZ_05665 [Nitrospiria bacterium]
MAKEKGSGVKNLLISQVLAVVLVYVAVLFYESDPLMTKVVVFMLAAGIFHFAWKGIRALWIKPQG